MYSSAMTFCMLQLATTLGYGLVCGFQIDGKVTKQTVIEQEISSVF